MSPFHQSPDGESEDNSLQVTALVAFVGIAFCALVAFSAENPEAEAAGSRVAVFDSALKNSLSDTKREMERPRRDLVIRNPSAPDGQTIVSNCITYLSSLTNHSMIDMRSKGGSAEEYADCFLYRLIPASRTPEYHIGRESRLGHAVAERLSPKTLPDGVPEEFKKSQRLSDIKTQTTDIGEKRVFLDKDGKTLEISILASADMLGDRVEDLAVRVKSGASVEYGVLTPDREGALQFIPGRSFEDNAYGPYQPYVVTTPRP